MKKRKIPITILLLFLIISLHPVTRCYAYAGINVPTFGGSTGGNNETPSYSIELSSDSNAKYTCDFTPSFGGNHDTKIYGYNPKDESIINGNVTPKENTLAGTAIGIKIEETTFITWSIDKITVYKITTTTIPKNCKKKVPNNCNGMVQYNSIIRFKLPFLVITNPCSPAYNYVPCTEGTSGCSCTGGGTETNTTEITSGAKYAECKTKAEEYVKGLIGTPGPSYNVKIMDSNDINATGNLTSLTTSGGCGVGSNSITCRYSYGIETVCLNVKTSEVRYLNKGTCSNDEIEVKNDNGHWHYFTPLNSKSNSEFSIIMANRSESGLQKKNFCQSLIEHNNNYLDFIRDKNHKKLTGNKNQDKLIVEAGCYLGVEINIPISQEFYHEDDDYKFKGFNFYYKPIDINDPFPNGVNQNSIWYEWSRSNNKKPDLTKSYSNATYVANYINVNEVRNYTKNNPYTSWDNMYLNGVSQFIEKENIVTRLVDKNSFYKLGCGPSNSDWSECKQ